MTSLLPGADEQQLKPEIVSDDMHINGGCAKVNNDS